VGKMQLLDNITSDKYSYHWAAEGYIKHVKMQNLKNFCNQKFWILLNMKLCTKRT